MRVITFDPRKYRRAELSEIKAGAKLYRFLHMPVSLAGEEVVILRLYDSDPNIIDIDGNILIDIQLGSGEVRKRYRITPKYYYVKGSVQERLL